MYNLKPNAATSKEARKIQAKRVNKSILYLINECAGKLQLQNNMINQTLSVLPTTASFSPEIHFLHHRLQTMMRNQDCINATSYLTKLTEAICYNNTLKEWIEISSIGPAEWEIFVIAEAMRLTKEGCGKTAEIAPISDIQLITAKDWIGAAIYTIARHDPNMFDELREHVKIIKLFCGKVTMGFTDVRILGAMLLRLPQPNVNPVLYFIEHIVHEASHMHLNCLLAADPLILNPADEKFISPLRSDPRPMIGVFHATYVSAKISRVFIKLYNATGNHELLHPLAETLDETIRGIEEIKKCAKLTQNGHQLVISMQEITESAHTLKEWKKYNFKETRPHRFGAGESKIDSFQRAIA